MPRQLADLCKIGIFAEKSVTRMDSVGVGDFRGADYGGDIKVAFRAFGGADTDGFVRKAHVQTMPVGFRVNRNGFDAEVVAGADDAKRDFAPIRN